MSTSSIGSVSGNSTLQQLEALYQKMEAKLAASTASTTSTTSATPTDTDSVSGIGKLLSNLQDLATSDPAKFKQETADIAARLKTAADGTTGDESTYLKGLANQFQQASDTGDPSALAPKHHSNHSHSSSASSNSSAASQYQSTNLMSMLNTDSTSANNYLSDSQDTLLNSLFGGNGK